MLNFIMYIYSILFYFPMYFVGLVYWLGPAMLAVAGILAYTSYRYSPKFHRAGRFIRAAGFTIAAYMTFISVSGSLAEIHTRNCITRLRDESCGIKTGMGKEKVEELIRSCGFNISYKSDDAYYLQPKYSVRMFDGNIYIVAVKYSKENQAWDIKCSVEDF